MTAAQSASGSRAVIASLSASGLDPASPGEDTGNPGRWRVQTATAARRALFDPERRARVNVNDGMRGASASPAHAAARPTASSRRVLFTDATSGGVVGGSLT